MSDFQYQSDSFDRQSQRFVIPLYIKDEVGNYHYSSTATLVLYNNSHYLIFASHALDSGVDINKVAFLGTDGVFIDLISLAIGYRIFKEDDLVIVDCFNRRMDGKNYFVINKTFSFNGFDKKHFSWTGFPQGWCKSKVIHHSKSADTIVKDNIVDSNGLYFKNARYFTIVSKLLSFNKIEITGKYDQKKIELKYKGAVSKGPSPQGMSGGAMYFFSHEQKLKDDIDSTFLFAGIGLRYKKDGTISGLSRYRVIDLLDQYDNESPLVMELRI